MDGTRINTLNMTVTIGGTEYCEIPSRTTFCDVQQLQSQVSDGQGAA